MELHYSMTAEFVIQITITNLRTTNLRTCEQNDRIENYKKNADRNYAITSCFVKVYTDYA